MLFVNDEAVENQSEGESLAPKAIVAMAKHMREARRYICRVHNHNLGPWKLKSPFHAEAVCKNCSVIHQAFITVDDRGEILKWSGCDYGLGMCSASKRGKARAAQLAAVGRGNSEELAA